MPGPEVPGGREVEWQLDAHDLRPVEHWITARFGEDADEGVTGRAGLWPPGLRVTARPVKRLADTYVDTEDWRLVRAGFMLRLRQRVGTPEATLKDMATSADGLRDRFQVTEVLAGAEIGALDPEGPVGRRVGALVGPRPLRPVLQVGTRRRPYDLLFDDALVGELALDDATVVAVGSPRRLQLRRVELEVLAPWVGALQPLVEQLRRDCGLQPAPLSTFESGLLAAGVVLPRPAAEEEAAPGADATVGDVATAALRRDLAAMVAHEPGTRLGDDPEDLHQMRVATRRLRAALALFGGVLPTPAAKLADELGWLAAALGAVRDVDVQLQDLDTWCEVLPGDHAHALDRLRHLLAVHRREVRALLLQALDAPRYERLEDGLRSLVDHPAARRGAGAAVPALAALPGLVEQRHRSAVRAAKRAMASGTLADAHRLRIRGKRLRYAVEFTSGLYGAAGRRFGKVVAGLQDQLGRVQDAEVAYRRLQVIASGEGSTLDADTVFAMGMVAQRCRDDALARLAAVGEPLALLRGDEWRRLSKAMGAGKAAVASAACAPGA